MTGNSIRPRLAVKKMKLYTEIFEYIRTSAFIFQSVSVLLTSGMVCLTDCPAATSNSSVALIASHCAINSIE
jgi:hypothetical protein